MSYLNANYYYNQFIINILLQSVNLKGCNFSPCGVETQQSIQVFRKIEKVKKHLSKLKPVGKY